MKSNYRAWDKNKEEMFDVDKYFDSLPEIPISVARFIEYMKKEHSEKETLYEVMIHISLFHYNDSDLEWIHESKENMNSFSLAWIIGEWIVFF